VSRLGAGLARFAIRWRRAVILVSLLLSATSLVSLTRLRLDIDLLEMLPAGRPAFDEYKAVLETFGATQTVVALVDGVEGAALADALDSLAARYRTVPELRAVIAGRGDDSSAPFLDPAHVAAFVPAAHLPDLAARLEPAAVEESVARAKRMLALPGTSDLTAFVRRDPLGLAAVVGAAIREGYADPAASAADRHFLTPEGDAGLILLHPTGSPFDAEFTHRLFDALGEAEAAVRAGDPALQPARVRHGGSYAHAREDAGLIAADVVRYTLLALVGVVLIFQLGFRDVTILPVVCYLLIASSLPAFAVASLLYDSLNALSLAFNAIFFGLAIDASIHFYGRLLDERRHASLEEAVVRTCSSIAGALVVASGTTAAAFAVVSWSEITAVRQIGELTGLGMVLNIVHTLVLLPALVVTFPGRLAAGPPSAVEMPWIGGVAAAASRHPRPVLGVTAAVAVAWLVGSGRIPVDAEILHLQPTDSPASRAEAELTARFGALAPRAAVVIAARDLDEALAREERVTAWLEPRRGEGTPTSVRGYQALSTFLPSRATEERRRAAFAALPRAAAAAALEHELRAQGFRVDAFAAAVRALTAEAHLPRDLDAPWIAPLVERHLRTDASGVRLVTFVEMGPGGDLAELRTSIRADLGDEIIVTGRDLMQRALHDVIAREVRLFALVTGVLNVLIVLAQVRSLSIAAAVVAPTIAAVLVLLAGMEACGVGFTPVTLMVLPLTLGIGVDNCVFLIERVREGRTIAEAGALVGRALLLVTLTTMAGFGFLAVSRYPALAGLGWLAFVAVGLVFLGAILVLPALLAVLPRAVASGTTHVIEDARSVD
jgi:predicted RND superfamily exporter protein